MGIVLVFPQAVFCTERHFAVTVAPQTQTVDVGTTARITLTEKNFGSQTEHMLQANNGPSHAEYDCTIRIHDQDGRTPASTEEGAIIYDKNPHYIQTVSRRVVEIRPGHTRVEELPVGVIFKLLSRHMYSLAVTYSPLLAALREPLTSNWVTMKVK